MWKNIINSIRILQAKRLLYSGKYTLWLSIFIGWTAILILGGCDEDITGDTGKEILPQEELVNLVYSDTFSIELQTQTRDSVPTCNTQLQMFGTYNDPLMGKVSTATYMVVLPTDSLWDFTRPNDLEFASMVLQIGLFGWYGNFQTPQKVQVYEIVESMPPCDDLDANSTLMLDRRKELSNGHNIDFSNDSTIRGIIRIPLDSSLANKFLFSQSENFSSDVAFKEFFKGLYLTSAPLKNGREEDGAVFRFDGSFDLDTRLFLYYKSRPDSLSDFEAKTSIFPIGVSQFSSRLAQKFVQITRSEMEGTPLEKSLSGGDEFEFVQAGSYLEIGGVFPSLKNLPPETGVNQVELILRVDTTQFSTVTDTGGAILTPPNVLEFLILNEDDEPISIPGVPIPQVPFISDQGVFRFPFTPFLQEVIDEEIENYTFLVRPIFQTNNPNLRSALFNQSINRVIFGGVDHPTLFPELRITYTTPQ